MARKKGPTGPAEPDVPLATGLAAGFPIVALGASAGGLQAFEQFFRHVRPNSGMAFVLVSHLDPDRVSLLKEILQRDTAMPVVEATDQVALAPNRVYVVPPNRDMAILGGALQLSVPDLPRGHRMPIDSFLRSLAEDQEDNAIGVILSGTGTDGTLGMRAIHGAGGLCFVQDPATAQYDGMPSSAIQAGYATRVLPVEKMPEQLLAAVRSRLVSADTSSPLAASTSTISRILMLLRSGTGHDFSQYKRNTIGRRIQRRMTACDIDDAEVYARYLKEHPEEVQLLFRGLLINVTSFFRDPDAFATLEQAILPAMFARKPDGYAFRIWVVGCSTGEEAYSLAMTLRECIGDNPREFKVQIFGTDLDADAIAVARAGVYPNNIVQDVTPERLHRFFVKEESGFRVKKEIREMVVFATQNVIKDPPFTKLDMLSCRNLLIYLEPELQHRLVTQFHYALNPEGVLFLSASEGIGRQPDLFAPLHRKWKFYQAIHSPASTRPVIVSGPAWAPDGVSHAPPVVTTTREIKVAEVAKRVLLQSFAPVSVVTDMKGTVIYVHGDTGKYLRPAPGEASLNVVDLAREGLKQELRAAIHAAAQGTVMPHREVTFTTDGESHRVNLIVRPLVDPEASLRLLLVSFQAVASLAGRRPGKRSPSVRDALRAEALEGELAYIRENLQATIEEQQASNEELQSTNEELQSTNEELETSKEELQSVNEELVTVNAEFQAKVEQLTDVQNDMKNLLDSINVAVVFLDEHLVIRRFTREAARIYHLVHSDVGRPLDDIKSHVESEDILPGAREVLESLVPRELEVRTPGGDVYLARIMPYRTLDNVIDGVVMTFTDISQRIVAEHAVRVARELAENIVNTVREPLVVLDGNFEVVSASRSFYRLFHTVPSAVVGRSFFSVANGQWDDSRLRAALQSILPSDSSFDDFEMPLDLPGLGSRTMLLNARRVVWPLGKKELILLAIEDVTGRMGVGG